MCLGVIWAWCRIDCKLAHNDLLSMVDTIRLEEQNLANEMLRIGDIV